MLLSPHLDTADTVKKEGKMEMQKFEYLEKEKSILYELKNIFHSFLIVIIWWKIKIYWKIADASFKFFLKNLEAGLVSLKLFKFCKFQSIFKTNTSLSKYIGSNVMVKSDFKIDIPPLLASEFSGDLTLIGYHNSCSICSIRDTKYLNSEVFSH